MSVPLADIGAANTNFYTVNLQEMLGHAQPAFYVDDISFTFAPVGTTTPGVTSTPTLAITRTPSRTSTPIHTPTRTPTHILTPAPTTTAIACEMTFPDVHPTDYFYSAVRYLYCSGVVSGFSDGTYRPYNSTTRGQLAKIIVRAVGFPINTAGGPHFTDVATNSTFYSYIETAYNAGLVSGYSDGTFRPNNNVSRGQLAKIIVGALDWEIDTSGGPHFPDVPQGSTFYTYIETAFNHHIVSGRPDGTYGPDAIATRGQIAKIVYLALGSPVLP